MKMTYLALTSIEPFEAPLLQIWANLAFLKLKQFEEVRLSETSLIT